MFFALFRLSLMSQAITFGMKPPLIIPANTMPIRFLSLLFLFIRKVSKKIKEKR